jgi:hypothetical protein
MYKVIHDKPKLNSSMSLIEEVCALSISFRLVSVVVWLYLTLAHYGSSSRL